MLRNLLIRVASNLVMLAAAIVAAFLLLLHTDIRLASVEGITIVTFLAYLVGERIIGIIDILLHEKSLEGMIDNNLHVVAGMEHEAARLTNAILQGHLTVYIDNTHAFDECTKIARRDDLISLRNTIFRYGSKNVRYSHATNYDEWVAAKKKMIENGKRVQELFDFPAEDYLLASAKAANESLMFDAKYLESPNIDIIQMTIFKYADNSREIFLGWDLKASRREPVFRTKNIELIEYFDKYYDSLYDVAKPLPQLAGPRAD